MKKLTKRQANINPLDRFKLVALLTEHLGAEVLLVELIKAMSNVEANENLEYIARMHDIELKEEV